MGMRFCGYAWPIWATGSGSSTCFGDQIIQTETLGREELHDAYTLRAFNCWEKERYETCTFTMCEE